MIFKVILAIAYFMIIIGINVRKTKESNTKDNTADCIQYVVTAQASVVNPERNQSPKIPIIPCNKTHKKQRKLRRVKRCYKKKSSKFNSKLPKLTIPKKQLHPKPWDSFSSYSPSDPFHAPTTTPFKPSSQSQIRPPAITHINFNLPPQSPPRRILHPLNPSSSLNPHKSLCPLTTTNQPKYN